MAKDEFIDVNEIDMIDELHGRIDVLLDLLEEKGVLNKAQYEARLEKYYNQKD